MFTSGQLFKRLLTHQTLFTTNSGYLKVTFTCAADFNGHPLIHDPGIPAVQFYSIRKGYPVALPQPITSTMMLNIFLALKPTVPQSLHLFLGCSSGRTMLTCSKAPLLSITTFPELSLGRLPSPQQVLGASPTAANLIASQGSSAACLQTDRENPPIRIPQILNP